VPRLDREPTDLWKWNVLDHARCLPAYTLQGRPYPRYLTVECLPYRGMLTVFVT
jgi:hypothetical protein